MKLAAAVRDGSVAAWMHAYGAELRAHLARFVDVDEAEDLLQEVWLTAHRRPPAGGGDTHVRAWLYRVATNAALDRLGRERRRRDLLRTRGHRLRGEAPPEADADVVSDEVRGRVREAVAQLPRKQREAVWLRWADGLTYEEVAERLGSSPESARANVYQGIKRLRQTLSELLGEEIS